MSKASKLKRSKKQAASNKSKGRNGNPSQFAKHAIDRLSEHYEVINLLCIVESKDLNAFIASVEALQAKGIDPFSIRAALDWTNAESHEKVDLIQYASWFESREIASWMIRMGLAEKRQEALEAAWQLVNGVNLLSDLEVKEKCADLLRKSFPPIDIDDARNMQLPAAYEGSYVQGEAREILIAQASAFVAEHERREICVAVGSAIAPAEKRAIQPARL